jgi:hypothetical protein
MAPVGVSQHRERLPFFMETGKDGASNAPATAELAAPSAVDAPKDAAARHYTTIAIGSRVSLVTTDECPCSSQQVEPNLVAKGQAR